jgi:hypothetical protein
MTDKPEPFFPGSAFAAHLEQLLADLKPLTGEAKRVVPGDATIRSRTVAWLDELCDCSYTQAVDGYCTHGSTPIEALERPLTVRYVSGYTNVSCCLLTDATGVMHCTHPAPPRPSWAKRTHWAIRSRWASLRLRVGSWVAGVDLGDRDD